MLIGLTGHIATGKDSVADVLEGQYGFMRMSYAKAVYRAVEALNPIVLCTPEGPVKLSQLIARIGWDAAKRDEKKYPEVRRLLQTMGSEVGRDMIGVDVWMRKVREAIADLPSGTDVVVTDVRFVNEDWHIHDQGGTLWRITRPDVGLTNLHVSERHQHELNADYELKNDGTLEDLKTKVAEALDWESARTKT